MSQRSLVRATLAQTIRMPAETVLDPTLRDLPSTRSAPCPHRWFIPGTFDLAEKDLQRGSSQDPVVAMTNAPTPPVEVTEVLNRHPYPLLAIDVDDLSIIGANQAASELLGTTSNSLRGTRVTEIVSSADRPAAEESVRLLIGGDQRLPGIPSHSEG